MKKLLSFILAVSIVLFTGATAFAAEDYPSVFSFAEADEKGIPYDKPITEKSQSELINDGLLFYGGTVPWPMARATVGKTYGYVVAKGQTPVYSGMGSGTELGYLTFKEVVYVNQIVGSYVNVTFKNASENLTTGYVPSAVVYTPAYGWYRPIIQGSVSLFYGDEVMDTKGNITNHLGVDVRAPAGTGLYAVNNGTVTYKETTKKTSSGNKVFAEYGKHAILSTVASGSTSIVAIYAHLSKFGNNVASNNYGSEGYPSSLQGTPAETVNVSAPISVTKASMIGYVGTTGFSSGNHLHFEMRSNGVVVDPFGYVVFPDVHWGK